MAAGASFLPVLLPRPGSMSGRGRRAAVCLWAIALLIGWSGMDVSTGRSQEQTPSRPRLFPETGQSVSGRFLRYWETHGALAQQGYPISPEFREKSDLNGRTYAVQYFERAVFEYHPENEPPYDVLLSQLGRWRYAEKYAGGPPPQAASPPPGSGATLFPETGKTVPGIFLDYWRSRGALAQQGYPLSEPVSETSEADGKTYTMQYFERAVFEYHPENKAPYDVLLSRLGAARLRQKYGEAPPATGMPRITALHNGTKEEGSREYAEVTNMGTAAQDLAGWSIARVSKGISPFKFPAGAQLAPGASVRVVSGPKASAAPGEYLWRATYAWCNEGDAATLLDPEGTVADRFFYGKPVDLAAGKTPCSR